MAESNNIMLILILCIFILCLNTIYYTYIVVDLPLASKTFLFDNVLLYSQGPFLLILHCSSISLVSVEVSLTSVSQVMSSIVRALLSPFGLTILYLKLFF